jgi:hypothetical protein
MKKLVCLVVVLAICLVMAMPLIAGAATFVQIGITATGSDISVTCNVTDWAVGTVHASDNISTTDNVWGNIVNATSEAVDISVHGHDMANGGTTWTLTDTGTGGAGAFSMWVLPDGDAPVRVVKTGTTAWLDELGAGSNHSFGLNFMAPTATLGNLLMTMGGDKLYFEATID